MTRFDIPDDVARLIDAAIKAQVIYMPELYVLVSDYGDDWLRLVDAICEISFARRHGDGGRQHAAIMRLAEAVRRKEE